jgi:hypothetical protein
LVPQLFIGNAAFPQGFRRGLKGSPMTNYPINYSAAEAVTLADGRIFRGPSCESNAARQLLADGLPPDTRLVFCRAGKPALRGDITAFAGRMWAGEARDPAHRPYSPHHRQNAISSARLAPKNGVAGFGSIEPPGGHGAVVAVLHGYVHIP